MCNVPMLGAAFSFGVGLRGHVVQLSVCDALTLMNSCNKELLHISQNEMHFLIKASHTGSESILWNL